MTEQQEDQLLSDLQDAWRDLAEALGWSHSEGVNYHKSNGVNEENYVYAKQKLKDLIERL